MIKFILMTSLFLYSNFVTAKSDFYMTLYNETYLASELNFDIGDKLNKDVPIDRPKNAWRTIFRGKVGSKSICLNYRVPHKERGILEFRESTGACDHYKGRKVISISGVSDLRAFLVDEKKRVPGKGLIEPFTLSLFYNLNGEEKSLFVPLVNVKGKKRFSRYGNGQEEQYLNGISFSRKPRTVLDVSGIYRENKAKACHQVNKRCQDITENLCNLCPNGWFEVVDYNCKQGGSKYCRPSHCGNRGEPACMRGFEFTGTERVDLCFSGSPAGYCKPGLNTYCDGNKILVCL